ncbi:MAG: ABC transporter ATP-binding protein [Flexilinea sp.]
MENPLLTIHNLSMSFPADDGELHALDSIDMVLHEHEFACIIGPSGSGKSTLLRILANVLTPSSGSVELNIARPVTRAIVFQNSNLLPWFTVIQNIALPLQIRGINDSAALEQASEWVEKVGLHGFENEWPKNLSGGMAQRVAIARALIQKPELLLLDEPFGSLDSLTREQMSLELLETWEQIHTTVLMVTHSISEAVLLADRVLVFGNRPGRIINRLKIHFSRPRDPDLRDSLEFIQTTKKLREMITPAKKEVPDIS